MSNGAQRFKQRKPSRKEKQKDTNTNAQRKPKWQEHRKHNVKHIVPKSTNQAKYLESLQHNQLVIACGPAGCGKTYLAACFAANELQLGNIEKVIITRPNVTLGESSGFLPGTSTQKLMPFCRPMIEAMRNQMGSEAFECNFGEEIGSNISIQALEHIRGMSFDNCILIVDEGQNTSVAEVKSIVTRIGENCQLIFCGDPKQHDMDGDSGIEFLKYMVGKYNISNADIVEFSSSDIVRSGICKDFVLAFEQEFGQ